MAAACLGLLRCALHGVLPRLPLPPPCPRPQVGQELDLLCLGKDAKGQVKLSRKALLARQAAQAAAKKAVEGGAGLDADK